MGTVKKFIKFARGTVAQINGKNCQRLKKCKNKVEKITTATCPQQKKECSKLICAALFLVGKFSIRGLAKTSIKPLPAAITIVAMVSPAMGGKTAGNVGRNISPAALTKLARQILFLYPSRPTNRVEEISTTSCVTKLMSSRKLIIL